MKKKNKKKAKSKIKYKKKINKNIKQKFKSKKRKKRKQNIKRNIKKEKNLLKTKKKDLFFSFVKIQENLTSLIKFKFKIDFLLLDKKIEGFFNNIEKKIENFKQARAEAIKRLKLERIELREKEKLKIEKEKKDEEEFLFKQKQKELKDEERLEKERARDIKLFLKKEQAIIRKEQAERQRKFLQEIKLDKQIEKFRLREVKELEKLERVALKEQRDDYTGLQERIEKLKEKYRQLRDQKIRERVEALGVKVKKGDDRETLLRKERDYNLARFKIEMALESFYRSANSLVFQLNKRHITRNMSIFRCIDRRFETGEIFIKWDESLDEEWLILIYIKNNSPDEGIVIEDKSNPEKNLSHEFKSSEIFKASDMMVDSLTQLISRKRQKN